MELYPRPQGPLQTSTGMACLQWTRSPLLFGAPLGDHLCRPDGWLGLWEMGGTVPLLSAFLSFPQS